jgi:CHAT domain-containing protein/tetratricopeptide (TPR) repeat protein
MSLNVSRQAFLALLLLLFGAPARAADLDALAEQVGLAAVEVEALRAALAGLPETAAQCVSQGPAAACIEQTGPSAQRILRTMAGLEAMASGDFADAARQLDAAAGSGGDDLLEAVVISSLGVAVGALGEFSVAAARTGEAIARAGGLLGHDHEYLSQLHLTRAWFQAQLGDQEEVLASCTKALRDPKASWLDNHPGVLCRNRVAGARFAAAQYRQAEALWSDSLRWYDANLAAADPQRIVIVGNLGRAAAEGGRPVDGVVRFREVVALSERRYGRSSEEVSTYRYFLADALVRSGRPAAAAVEYVRIVEQRTAAHGAFGPETAQALEWLGVAEQRRGRYAAAESALTRSYEGLLEHLPGTLHLASAAAKLGELHREMGHFARARPLLAEALAVAEAALGAQHPDVAVHLLNEGNLLRVTGDLAAAKERYERALQVLEASLGPDHPSVATALTNMAGLSSQLGDRAGTGALLERAVAIYERSLPFDHEFLAAGLNNLGTHQLAGGDLEGAALSLERAAGVWERSLGPAHPNTLVCLRNLAQALVGSGRAQEAVELLAQAAVRAEARLGPAHPAVAGVRTQQAEALSWAGDQHGALALYRSALPDLEAALGPSHPDLARPLTDLARAERLVGNEQAARRALERVASIVQGQILPLLDATSERERIELVQSLRHHADLALSVFDRPDDTVASYRTLLSWKGAVLGSLRAQRAVALGSSDPDLQAAARELTAVRQDLAEAVFSEPGAEGPPRVERLAALSGRKEALERELSRAGGGADLPIDPAQVCARLDPTEVLVDFVRYERRPPPVVGVAESPPVESYAAFMLLGGACDVPLRRELGPAGPIDEAIRRWRKGVTRGAAGGAVQRRGEELRRAIWDPLEPGLGGRTTVRLVPDGTLSGLPFGALPDGDGFLVSRFTFSYLGAAGDLVRPENPPGRGALVVGGILYDAASDPSAEAPATRSPPRGGLPEFGFLPGTAAEADDVAEALGAGVVRLSGAEASERRVRELLPGKRVVHIATHGFFAADGARSSLHGAGAEAALALSPLLRTGLVLAGGALDTERIGGDDGLLTAEEVLGLDLRGVQLVVLSACETGLGEVEDGEGVMGMRRAFALAGVETLLLSLWKVPDAETRLLMAAFYARLAAGAGPAAALQGAQAERIERLTAERGAAPPFLWAAFVASGG